MYKSRKWWTLWGGPKKLYRVVCFHSFPQVGIKKGLEPKMFQGKIAFL